MMIGYVGDVDHIGVTEITNLLIAVDDEGRSADLKRTFAAQEAPLVPVDWLPNQMDEPAEMGRYIQMLMTQISGYSKKRDMRKVLKRCASLSRVLFATDISNEIAELANRTSILLNHKLDELKACSKLLNGQSDERSTRLHGLIEVQLRELGDVLMKRGGKPDSVATDRFNIEVDRIIPESSLIRVPMTSSSTVSPANPTVRACEPFCTPLLSSPCCGSAARMRDRIPVWS
jgi:hypothetical protein